MSKGKPPSNLVDLKAKVAKTNTFIDKRTQRVTAKVCTLHIYKDMLTIASRLRRGGHDKDFSQQMSSKTFHMPRVQKEKRG